ncbi:MAG: multicopper oxidase family protein [Alphaproteobacteria bacterium]
MSQPKVTRRDVLGGIAVSALLPRVVLAQAGFDLRARRKTLEVNGRAASVLELASGNGAPGVRLRPGERFVAALTNEAGEPTLIHWHGQTPPTEQDGVPGLSQPALGPAASYAYDFAPRPGTHWMHSHVGLQEQRLLAAPMIVESAQDAGQDEQEIVLFLQDFTFRAPEEILAELMAGGGAHAAHAAHGMRALNDVEHDAVLANERTLDDPEVVSVEAGGRVRLRVINATASTNLWLDLGALEGVVVAVDGDAVAPVAGSLFPLAIAQRLDVRVTVPGSGAWAILALREGGAERTGIMLATTGAAITRHASKGEAKAPAVDLGLERRLSAVTGLASRPADRTIDIALTGGGADYVWGINGRRYGEGAPITLGLGERVHLVLRNETTMAHPMHLHGHHFQVVAIDGTALLGAVRDTVLVPIEGTVTVAFDANNPGRWALHCHNLYHMDAGMMAELAYQG